MKTVVGWSDAQNVIETVAQEFGLAVFRLEIREFKHGGKPGSPRGVVLSVDRTERPRVANYFRGFNASDVAKDVVRWLESVR